MVSMKQMPKPTNQPLEAGRVKTMALIFSVTVPKVCPGSMTGARSRSVVDLYCSGILCLFVILRAAICAVRRISVLAGSTGATCNCIGPSTRKRRRSQDDNPNRGQQNLRPGLLQFRIRVTYFRQVRCARLGIQFAEQSVVARLLLQP